MNIDLSQSASNGFYAALFILFVVLVCIGLGAIIGDAQERASKSISGMLTYGLVLVVIYALAKK